MNVELVLSTPHCDYVRSIQMPFVPAVGMQIDFSTDEADLPIVEVLRVTYNCAVDRLWCFVTLRRNLGGNPETLSEKTEEWLRDTGFKISGS